MSNINTALTTVATSDLDAVTGGTTGSSSDLTTQLTALKSSVDGIASSQTANSSSSSNNMMLPLMMMAMNRPQAAPTVVAAGGPPAVIAGGAPVINVNTRVRRGC